MYIMCLNNYKLSVEIKKRNNPLGAKNNDSHLEKWVIVIFYTLKNQKCGNSE